MINNNKDLRKLEHFSKSSRLSVIEALIEFGPMSRSDLASNLNLTRSALTELSRELMARNLVRETSVRHNGGRQGRPSTLLELNEQCGYFIGVCITDHPPMLVLCDLYGNVIGGCEIAATDQPEAIAKAIKMGIDRLLKASGISKKAILGIGLAISGFVDPEQGVCRHSNELGWYDVPIVEVVTRISGIPTYIENDANAVASGEKIFGHARKAENFTIVTLNRTIGAGHYIHGNLYRGQNGGAGEIGHCTMIPDGQLCRCGKRGCLDTIAGSKAILDVAHECQLVAETVLGIEALAVNGNMAAINILRRAGQALGLAVANIIQITNPEMVLFAFSEDIRNGILLTSVRQTIENNIFPRFLPKTRLLFHQVDENFRARGAASIAAHEFFRLQASA